MSPKGAPKINDHPGSGSGSGSGLGLGARGSGSGSGLGLGARAGPLCAFILLEKWLGRLGRSFLTYYRKYLKIEVDGLEKWKNRQYGWAGCLKIEVDGLEKWKKWKNRQHGWAG